jgi:hypothetical protein
LLIKTRKRQWYYKVFFNLARSEKGGGMNQLCRNNLTQLVEALLCPVNRHAVREKYGWNDWDLFHNPDVLVQHYVENGGAEKNAQLRNERG